MPNLIMSERGFSWMFKHISEPTLRRWATSLQLFRFVRSSWGYGQLQDSLQARFQLQSEADVCAFYAALGLPLMTLEPDALTQDNPPAGMQPLDIMRLPRRLPDQPQLTCPDFVQRPFGVKTYVAPLRGSIYNLTVVGNEVEHSVTERDVEGALLLEQHLMPLPPRLLDPPVDTWLCVAPSTYPEIWRREPFRQDLLALSPATCEFQLDWQTTGESSTH